MTVLIILTISLFSFAKKPECTVDFVTRNCDFYKEKQNQSEIKLKDGTIIYNPLASVMMADTSVKISNVYTGENDVVEMLDRQGKIIDLLGSKVSSPYKMSLVQMYTSIYSGGDEGMMTIPWPPDSNKPQLVTKKNKEIKEDLESRLGKDVETFKSLIQPDIEKIKKNAEAFKKVLQEEENRRLAEAKVLEIREKQVRNLFKDAKEQLIQIIARGKPESQLTVEEKKQIRKIELIELNLGSQNSFCNRSPNNGHYDPMGMTIELCPKALTNPDVSLMGMFGHELAHSIDTCNNQFDIYQIDQEKLKNYLLAKDDDNSDSADIIKLKFLHNNKNKYLSMNPDLFFSNENLISTLLNNNVLKKIGEGTSKDKHPFKKEYQCLNKKLKIMSVDDSDVNNTKRYFAKKFNSQTVNQSEKESYESYLRALKNYPECLQAATHKSQLGEAFGDMFGALLMEKKLSEKREILEEDKISSVYIFGITGCTLLNKPAPLPPIFFQSAFQRMADSHPYDKDRIEKILLNLPSKEQLFNCKRKYNACFDHLSLINRGQSSEDVQNQKGIQGK